VTERLKNQKTLCNHQTIIVGLRGKDDVPLISSY
jgi:hypothetical protein